MPTNVVCACSQSSEAQNSLQKFLMLALSLVGGGLLPLAFAPFDFYPLAVLCPALLAHIWYQSTAKQAFINGFIFGVGFFAVGVYWIFISIHTYGETNLFISFIATALFICALALFPAVQGYVLARFFKTKSMAIYTLLTFPLGWVVFEFLRSHLLTGFPWLLLGYSQVNSPLAGFSPLLGIYGVSWLCVLSSGLLLLIVQKRQARQDGQTRGSAPTMFSCFFILAVIWFEGSLLTRHDWTQPVGKPIQVSLIQGNIPQSVKWNPHYIDDSLLTYYELTQQNWSSKIIVWPEAAVPLPQTDATSLLDHLNAQAKLHHSTLMTGIPIQQGTIFYNGLIALGQNQGKYLKRHLVPFGEYVPFENLLRGLFGFLNLPMSDFMPGHSDQPLLKISGLLLAPSICYEVAYQREILSALPQANLLLTITDDAWFGHSIAQAQHLQIAQFRAQETGRYLLFASNNGITAVINPKGQIQTKIAPYQKAVLTDRIQGMQGKTPIVWLSHL